MPTDLLKSAKTLAAAQDKSLSQLMTESLQEKIVMSTGYREAMERQLKRLKTGLPLGLKDRRAVPRDELHERR
jgi:hypothetical protein